MTKHMKLIHRYIAVLAIVFIVLHMITHLSGLWGITAYNATQTLFRALYQTPITEPILLTAFAIQLVSGLILLTRQIRRGLRGPWARTQAISGGIILFFATQHMISFAISRWLDGLNTNFYWPASVMSGAPFIYYFIPYYFAGVVAMFIHIGCALRLILLRKSRPKTANRAFWALTAAGIATATAIILMLSGAFYTVTLPTEWITYLQRFIPGYQP